MVECPVCNNEIWDADADACIDCNNLLAQWDYSPDLLTDDLLNDPPVIRCCRCGTCPTSGDRTCRGCASHFLKPVPNWLTADSPGWTESDRLDPESTFQCRSCGGTVPLGDAKCRRCGLDFQRAAEHSAAIGNAIFSTHEELSEIIITRAKAIFGIDIDPSVAFGLARISQGTAANAINLLKTIVRMAQAETKAPLTGAEITPLLVATSLKRMGRDPWVGLDRAQRKYLVALAGEGGRGLSAANLATMANEKVSTIETMVEPFLMQRSMMPYFDPDDGQWHGMEGAFVLWTKSGLCPTALTYKYLEMAKARQDEDPEWFMGENLSLNSMGEKTPEAVMDDQESSLNPEAEHVPVPAAAAIPNFVTLSTPTATQTTTHSHPVTAQQTAASLKAHRAALLTSRDANYQNLLSSGDILPVPSAHWLSQQPVVCVNGHQSDFGIFATLPGYGTFANLPDFEHRGPHRIAAALDKLRGTAKHVINDRDPKLDARWELACPTCGTDHYTFLSPSLQEYTMCTVSPDLFWIVCHLYRKRFAECANCSIRKVFWDGLRLSE